MASKLFTFVRNWNDQRDQDVDDVIIYSVFLHIRKTSKKLIIAICMIWFSWKWKPQILHQNMNERDKF